MNCTFQKKCLLSKWTLKSVIENWRLFLLAMPEIWFLRQQLILSSHSLFLNVKKLQAFLRVFAPAKFALGPFIFSYGAITNIDTYLWLLPIKTKEGKMHKKALKWMETMKLNLGRICWFGLELRRLSSHWSKLSWISSLLYVKIVTN